MRRETVLEVGEYLVLEKLSEEKHRLVFRGRSKREGPPVILHVAADESPPDHVQLAFQREHELLGHLQIPGVTRLLKYGAHRQRPYLVYENPGAPALRQRLASGPLPLASALRIARQLAGTLAALHGQDIVHRDLRPEHILVSDTGTVTLTGFGLATRDVSLNLVGGVLRSPEGTPAYLSPEQTGRLNRPVDYRTDLYSLGVVLYEMLAGHLPFRNTDPIELIHAHIAKEAPPLEEAVFGLPRVVGELVLKLLAKSAEERFQSASALEADLALCLTRLEQDGRIDPFPIGSTDTPQKLSFPQRLYGRDAEKKALLEALESRIGVGLAEMVLVLGYSGVGKSSVVNEMRRPVAERRGHFVSGKFDQLSRSVPYSAIIQALQELVRQQLTLSPERLSKLKQALSAAVGINGRVLIDVIPDFELLLGPQPEVPTLSSTEAENRFVLIFLRVLRMLCGADHPVVLFLDDLQWADGGSLRLLQQILGDGELGKLLIIGACRDNELHPGHRLVEALQSIESSGTRVRRITLAPLGVEPFQQMLSDMLRRPAEDVADFAHLMLQRTGGNPFFLRASLRHLHEIRALRFDPVAGRWQWELEALRRLEHTDNVIDLLSQRLRGLSDQTRAVVTLAACIGDRFELSTLSLIHESSHEHTVSLLHPVLEDGTLIKLPGDSEDSQEYRFAHDRLRQAAYSLIESEELPQLHQRVGRTLLRSRPERIFEVAHHLNKALPLLTSQAERVELAEVNLRAARAAWAAHAFAAAGTFADTGLELLPASCWDTHYVLTQELSLIAAQAGTKAGDDAKMLRHSNAVIAHARTILDKVEAYKSQIEHYSAATNRMGEAAAIGIKTLRLVGLDVPDNPTKAHVLSRLVAMKLRLRWKTREALMALPPCTNPQIIEALRLIPRLSGSFYSAMPNAYPIVGLEALRLTLKHGLSAQSPHGFLIYAMINAAVLGDIETSNKFASIARELAQRFDSRLLMGPMDVVSYTAMTHWSMPLRESAERLRKATESCLDVGDHNYAAHGAGFRQWHLLFTGTPVRQLRDGLAGLVQQMQALRQPLYTTMGRMFHQWTLCLLGASSSPTRLEGEFFDETRTIPDFVKAKNNNGLFLFYLAKEVLCLLMGEETLALESSDKAERHKKGAVGTVPLAQHHFYRALILLRNVHAEGARPREAVRQARDTLKTLRKWEGYCEETFRCKADLVDAELARVRGDVAHASGLYDRAIEGARNAGFLHEAALAHELAAHFHLANGSRHAAHAYLHGAHSEYTSWEAFGKVAQLERSHPDTFMVARRVLLDASADLAPGPRASGVGTGADTLPLIDLFSVIKASRAISSEIELQALLARLMRIVLENAGAQRGLLIRVRDNELMVEAEGNVGIEMLPCSPAPVHGDPRLSGAIVNYVAQTRESLVLDNAMEDNRFSGDPYIATHRPKSVLAAPLLNQGKLVALIYLENNLTVGAFTTDRIEILMLLLAQAALSLQNAALYDSLKETNTRLEEYNRTLEQRVEERTGQLRETQQQLVIKQKLASLGALTAGIAHELKNPLNFINNFAQLSTDLSQEIIDLLQPIRGSLPDSLADLPVLLGALATNCSKISSYGMRANSIIDGMLLHSRSTTSQREQVDLNTLLADCVRMACQEVRNKTPSFEVQIDASYDPAVGTLELAPQDVSRVFINIVNNACYALRQKQRAQPPGFSPVLAIRTEDLGERVRVRIRDNGTGIPEDVLDKIYNPFFTTKPPGEGTGLGLSISQDIVAGHGGEMSVSSLRNEFTEFTIMLPRKAPPSPAMKGVSFAVPRS